MGSKHHRPTEGSGCENAQINIWPKMSPPGHDPAVNFPSFSSGTWLSGPGQNLDRHHFQTTYLACSIRSEPRNQFPPELPHFLGAGEAGWFSREHFLPFPSPRPVVRAAGIALSAVFLLSAPQSDRHNRPIRHSVGLRRQAQCFSAACFAARFSSPQRRKERPPPLGTPRLLPPPAV